MQKAYRGRLDYYKIGIKIKKGKWIGKWRIMIIKIYKTKNLNLDTVEKMLIMADKQANFNPESYWILSSYDGEELDYSDNEEDFTRSFKELSVKWIGRESVINWLVSNQILFEVISQDLLPEEREALGEVFEETKLELKPNLLN